MNKYILYFITIFTAYCSIQYELYISNTLGLLTNSYITWQTLTVGVYILGLGIGTYLYEKLKPDTIKTFINVELLLSILGLASVLLILYLRSYFRIANISIYSSETIVEYFQSKSFFMYAFGISSQVSTILVAVLSGFEIPLLYALFKKNNDDNFGKVLGLHHFGTLVGTVLFALVLVPYIDLTKTVFQTAFINFIILIILIFHTKINYRSILKITSFVLCSFLFLKFNPRVYQYMLKTYYYLQHDVQEDFKNVYEAIDHFKENHHKYKDIEIRKSAYQNMHMFNYKSLRYKEDAFYFYLDYRFQFDTYTESSYHENCAHFPLMATGYRPKKVLVLGAGDGLLAEELLKHDFIEQIVQVELDPVMYELATTNPTFLKYNNNSLKDPRVKMLFMDALYYIKHTQEKFDAIFIDFPYPYTYNLARLYSVEFYHYVRKTLGPQGFIVLDLPLAPDIPQTYEFTEDEYHLNSAVLSTFRYLNFTEMLPYHAISETFLFLADHEIKFNKDFDKDYPIKMEMLDEALYKEHFKAKFPHYYDPKLVNSIFKPTILFNLAIDF